MVQHSKVGVKPQIEPLTVLDRELRKVGINPKYICLHKRSKTPAQKWKFKKAWMHLEEALSVRRQGYNIGVLALPGASLAVVDIDRPDRRLERIVGGTLTVRTANGGLHCYFKNTMQIPNQVIMRDGEPIGEVRTAWQYVVAPGCFVPPRPGSLGDGVYRFIWHRDSPYVRSLTPRLASLLGLSLGRKKRKVTPDQRSLVSLVRS